MSRPIASGKEAKSILRIGEFYGSVDETLAKNGFGPNRKQRQPVCELVQSA